MSNLTQRTTIPADAPMITGGFVQFGDLWDPALGAPTAPGRLSWDPATLGGAGPDEVQPRLQGKLFAPALAGLGLHAKVFIEYKDAWYNLIPASGRTDTVQVNAAGWAPVDFSPFSAPNIFAVSVTISGEDPAAAPGTYIVQGSYEAPIS